MMPRFRFVSLTATGIAALCLCGCAPAAPTAPAAKVAAAIEKLGGKPATSLQQLVLYKSPENDDFAQDIVFLVPAKNGRDYTIVDTQGETFTDFRDFLENNDWEN